VRYRSLMLWFTLLLVFGGIPTVQAAQTIYHVSSVNPAADDNNPGTAELPWKTLEKVNASINGLQPGDQVLFERGSTFNGSLLIQNKSGTVESPITFGAYGTGDKPIINGFETLTGWQSLGGNRWESTCNNCGAQANLLMMNGVIQTLARYPNLNEEDKGYLYYESFVVDTSITDTELPNEPNWTGAELVLRTQMWILDRLPIQSHMNGTLTFNIDTPGGDIRAGYGYFIQNHIAALDQQGEWVYNPSTSKVTIYSTNDPNASLVQISTPDTLWELRNTQNIILRDLTLQGGDEMNLYIVNCTNVKVEALTIVNGGAEGVKVINCTNLEFSNSTIQHMLNQGFRTTACINCLVHHNSIEDIALFAGMGKSGNLQYGAVIFNGTDSIFEYNRVNRIGFGAVRVEGRNEIRYNYISYFNMVKTDSGGIFCWHNEGSKIIGNIILYGFGDTVAIPWDSEGTHGIYIDDNSSNIEIRDNTIGYMSNSGIFLHNARNNTVVNNTVFAVGDHQMLYIDDDLGDFVVEQNTVNNNIMFGVGAESQAAYFSSSLLGEEYLDRIGTIDRNIICNPFYQNVVGTMYLVNGSRRGQVRSLPEWQSLSGYDTRSQTCPVTYPTHTVNEVLSENRVTNSTFETHQIGWFGWMPASLELGWENHPTMGGAMRARHIGTDPNVNIATEIGGVEAGQVYRLRFDVLTNAPDRSVIVRFVGTEPASTGPMISLTIPMNRQVQSYEVFLPANATYTKARIVFQLDQSDQMMWLDNVELHRVSAAPVSDVIRFEYNDSESNRVIEISGANYTDPRGNIYLSGSSLTLTPYQSVILMKMIGENLLVNGGFEQDANDNRQPDMWKIKNISDDKVVCNKPTKSFAQEGKCTLRFKGSSAPSSKFSQKLTVNGLGSPQSLTLNAQVMAKKAQEGGLLKLRVKYADRTKGKLNVVIPSGSYDYTPLSETLPLTGTVSSIKVGIQYFAGSGKVWIDNVGLFMDGTAERVIELPELPLPLP
jgi:parallel beta-helix repeat protein